MITSNRVSYLDGLRGILAIIVFFHHFFYAFFPELVFGGSPKEFSTTGFTFKKLFALTPFNIVLNPGMAILFFFLLSGYVQTKVYFDTNNSLILQKGFIKRYFRLAIPTFSILTLVFIFQKLNFINNHDFPLNNLSNKWALSQMPPLPNFWTVVHHGFYACFYSASRYYQVLWTMPIELINSFAVLVLAITSHGLKNKHWLFIAWLLVQLFLVRSCNGVAFTLGLLFAYYQKNSVKFNSFLSRPITKLICWIFGIYFASYPHMHYQGSIEHSVYKPISFFEVYPHIISLLIGVTLLFCALLYSHKLQKILSHKILLFFGNISFMFYLVHFLFLFSFSPWLYHYFPGSYSFTGKLFFTCAASFALTVLASFILYTLVDKPVLSLCNKYVKKIFGA